MMGSSMGKIKPSLGLSWVVEIMLPSQEKAVTAIAFLASNLVLDQFPEIGPNWFSSENLATLKCGEMQ